MRVYPQYIWKHFKEGHEAIASYNGVLKYVCYCKGKWLDEQGDKVIPDFLLQLYNDINDDSSTNESINLETINLLRTAIQLLECYGRPTYPHSELDKFIEKVNKHLSAKDA